MKAKFLGVEIDNSLRFKNHIQELTARAEKRLNILKILAWGGTEPKTMIRLYKVYIRSIFEYGSVSFLHCPDSLLEMMQKIQNKAIRVSLRLPRYVSVKLLHDSSCLPTIKERLVQLGRRLVTRMEQSNPMIKNLIKERQSRLLKSIRQHGHITAQPHRSPLDVILPVQ